MSGESCRLVRRLPAFLDERLVAGMRDAFSAVARFQLVGSNAIEIFADEKLQGILHKVSQSVK